MSYLFRSWKESLYLLKPQNLVLFCLVFLKRIVHSYKTIIRDFWWLFFVSIFLECIYDKYFGKTSYFVLIPLFSWIIFIFCIYLVLRSSVQKKSYAYYANYYRHFILFVLLGIPIFVLTYFATMGSMMLFCLLPENIFFFLIAKSMFLLPLGQLFIVPITTFTILFFLDSSGTFMDCIYALWAGFKMVVYNYPFCFIFLLLLNTLIFLLSFSLLYLPHACFFTSFLSQATLPIPLALLTLFYTKRTHEQFLLYYREHNKE